MRCLLLASIAVLLTGAAVGCSSSRQVASSGTSAGAHPVVGNDTGAPTPDSLEHRGFPATVVRDPTVVRPRPHTLSPLADSLAQYFVFYPSIETWYLAAERGKRLLVDLGRVDADVRKTPRLRAAYREAVNALSPIPVGARFRMRGPWGTENAVMSGLDSWNGRIVAVVTPSAHLDSIMRQASHARVALLASAQRIDSAAEVVRDTCLRDSVPEDLRDRAAFVRDSLEQWLRDHELPPYERLVNTLRATSSTAVGCFGAGRRLALVVDLRAGASEWIRERAVMLDTLGQVTPLRVEDYRFKGHQLVGAFDADGDGVDDVAARGATDFAGGLVILSLSSDNRLQRLAGGFAWETR